MFLCDPIPIYSAFLPMVDRFSRLRELRYDLLVVKIAKLTPGAGFILETEVMVTPLFIEWRLWKVRLLGPHRFHG